MKTIKTLTWCLLLAGCAGLERSCGGWSAQTLGADWLVAQYDCSGRQIHCWKLSDTSIANEQQSDGIYWKAPTGHMVHIGGWYTRVQVADGDYAGAAERNNIELEGCRQ